MKRTEVDCFLVVDAIGAGMSRAWASRKLSISLGTFLEEDSCGKWEPNSSL
jgi:hypothetical protein